MLDLSKVTASRELGDDENKRLNEKSTLPCPNCGNVDINVGEYENLGVCAICYYEPLTF